MNLLKLFDDLDKTCKSGYNQKGENNNNWQGGIRHGSRIMIYAPNHPHADINNYVYRSRLVMEKRIGRFLKSDEVVHHKDKNELNDNPDNLRLCIDDSEHQVKYHRYKNKYKGRASNGRFR